MFVNCLDILEPHPLIWILQMESYQLVVIILTRYSHCVWMNIHAVMRDLLPWQATGKHFHSSYITVIIVQFLHYCCEKCLVFMCPLYV